jgi:hypothetical protein
MFFGSHHFGRVEGRAGASGWDKKELTSFTYSPKPTHNKMKVVST